MKLGWEPFLLSAALSMLANFVQKQAGQTLFVKIYVMQSANKSLGVATFYVC